MARTAALIAAGLMVSTLAFPARAHAQGFARPTLRVDFGAGMPATHGPVPFAQTHQPQRVAVGAHVMHRPAAFGIVQARPNVHALDCATRVVSAGHHIDRGTNFAGTPPAATGGIRLVHVAPCVARR